ncbi:hypothetical protein EV361DRAFT_955159 [Lentinula raphanica]|uniref:DUF6532 domain-containing protein n=1 Tax=Lentinula raphanica TaxID=153919 RepID=A0AA38P0R9_9AGAR|nr:hypothetical protein F5878DRAFT_664980 [Lentinula raphanica]KAJ3965293.1 hypothetical protein EV361DRAFT_955159 [Lentinula raphanica]
MSYIGYLDNYRMSILKLLHLKNTSYYWSAIKQKIHPIVKMAYELPFSLQVSALPENCNSEYETKLTQETVEKLLMLNEFLKHGHDENISETNNIVHPGIRDSIIEAYYKDSAGITQKFPAQFSETVPLVPLAFIMTVVHNIIKVYAPSPVYKLQRTDGTYIKTYVVMSDVIDLSSENEVHWNKLLGILKSWAKSGCRAAGMSISGQGQERVRSAAALGLILD